MCLSPSSAEQKGGSVVVCKASVMQMIEAVKLGELKACGFTKKTP